MLVFFPIVNGMLMLVRTMFLGTGMNVGFGADMCFMRMAVFVIMLMGMRHASVAVLVGVNVSMLMGMNMAMFMIGFHDSPPLII